MKVDILLGLQWGDEGKGKIVDVLAPAYDIIARFQGGPNAGHTIEFNGQKHVLHTIPSGIFRQNTLNVIGNGVIIDPFIFQKEIDKLLECNINPYDNLLISRKSHLILPSHRLLDACYEKSKGANKIGSTLKGIGPTYTDKVSRNGLRIGDFELAGFDVKYNQLKAQHQSIIQAMGIDVSEILLDGFDFNTYEKHWFSSLQLMKRFQFINSEYFINEQLLKGKKILAEGAQGSLLDIDFGSYPFVTSSNTVSAGVCTGLGIAPQKVGKVLGVFKAYCTRVGSGPFPTELNDEQGALLRENGREFGSTTGRPRRCGWLDIPALRYSLILNGVTDLVMMKADVLDSFETLKVCTSYKTQNEILTELPFDMNCDITPIYEEVSGWNTSLANLQSFHDFPVALSQYNDFIEKQIQMPIGAVSIGPDRTQTIFNDTFKSTFKL
ncbi:MAG: adenylosuccinate synthase [Bacteroidota bacterium]